MRPGITVQHANLPRRRLGLVRCDITGIIAFILPDRWPEGAARGDLVQLVLRRPEELTDHPARRYFSATTVRSVLAFFENGGDTCHLYGVFIQDPSDLFQASDLDGALAPLLQKLRAEEDIALLAVPDSAHLAFSVDRQGHIEAQAEVLWDTLLAHCREMGNRFLILDAPRDLHGTGLTQWVQEWSRRSPENRPYGAVYYPWLRKGDERYPASGAMAGVYARVEREHEPFGVVWPPANVSVRGATHVDVDLDWVEAGELSAESINPLVVQPARGVVVWGARTLSRDPNWQYINSRRVVSMISEQLRRDNEWVVFEQNDKKIWKVLERDVAVRLEEFWRAGLITGETRHGDYEVKCDEETNPLVERETGKLNVRVSLRPIGTTEHITIDLRLGEVPS